MRYVRAKSARAVEDKAYRIYATDALKMLTENTARQGGTHFQRRFIDIMNNEPQETRTEEEIIQSIRDKILKLGE